MRPRGFTWVRAVGLRGWAGVATAGYTPQMAAAARKLFRHLVDRPDHEIDLARAALALAADEYPGLEANRYVDRLD